VVGAGFTVLEVGAGAGELFPLQLNTEGPERHNCSGKIILYIKILTWNGVTLQVVVDVDSNTRIRS